MKRTALKPGKALARGGALKRTSRLRRGRGHQLNPITRRSLTLRSGGRCEVVYSGHRCPNPAADAHHRRTRRRSGKPDDRLVNLIDACRSCHTWIHAHPHWSADQGYLLPSTS